MIFQRQPTDKWRNEVPGARLFLQTIARNGTQVVELTPRTGNGGEEAFQLRRWKYGF